ncbi:MAG TPA: tetratricopeptide repeat protein [Chitinophagaceae bacterium]
MKIVELTPFRQIFAYSFFLRRSVILLCVFIVPVFYASAQSASQQKKNLQVPGADTVLVNNYLQAANRLADSNPDSCKIFLAHAIQLADSIHYRKGIVQYYHGMVYLLTGENKFEDALANAKKEVKLAGELHQPLLLAKSFNSLANSYEYLGIMDSAAKYFLKALQIADNLQDKTMQRKLNNNLSSVLYYTGDYKKGFKYAMKGYEQARSLNDTIAIISSLLNIGGFEAALKNYDSSLRHFNEVIELAEQTKNEVKMMDALNNLGELLSELGRNEEALNNYRRMLTLSRQYMRPDYTMYAEGNMGNTLSKLARYKEAEPHLLKAIHIAENIHAANELQQWLGFMADLLHKKGDDESAFNYLTQYQDLKDSLMNVQTKQNVHQLEVQYQTIKKDKELSDQRLAINRQRTAIQRKNNWLLLFIVGFIALVAILLISFRNYRNKKRLHQQTMLSLQKEQEVIRLKAMMEGQEKERKRISGEMHDDIGSGLTTILFLSNHLKDNSISVNETAAGKIAEYANSLIGKMNEIIWSMNTDYNTLDDLVAYIRHQSSELLENANIHYRFNIPDNIPVMKLSGEQRRNIFLVVKEALHNIIKHAHADLATIDIRIDKELAIFIRDDGKGIDKEKNHRFGNGLTNMRMRMQSIGGSFQIMEDNGTLVHLTVPLPG